MSRARLFSIVALYFAALTTRAQNEITAEMTATYIHHAFEITVPYHNVHQGTYCLEVITSAKPRGQDPRALESVVKASAAKRHMGSQPHP